MFDNVLVPIDGSHTARRAAKVGLELAAECDADVALLHIDRRRDSDEDTEHEDDPDQHEVFRAVRDLDIAGSPQVETYLSTGRPHEAIGDHVDEHGIDLIVMGRRGRAGVAEHILGSVAERVLRQVEAPVVTVPDGALGPETGRDWGDVLVTTDGSEMAERAGPHARTLARQLEATLHLVRVVNLASEGGVFNAGGVSESFIDRLETAGRADLTEFAEALETAEIDHRQALLDGEVHTELASYVDEHDVDLVVMASEGETNIIGQRIGSTTRRVLQTVDRPVLVVPIPD